MKKFLKYFRGRPLAFIIAVSLAVHFLIGIFFGDSILFNILNPPEPILEAPPVLENIEPVKKEYEFKMKRSQQKSAAPAAIPIIADIPSNVSLDNIDLNITSPTQDTVVRGTGDTGIGSGFGDGFASGSSFSIEFFGIEGGGNNVVFVIDYSASMKKAGKETIMRREATRVIQELQEGMNFGLIFFAGPAWSAFDKPWDKSFKNWVATKKNRGFDMSSFRPKNWNKLAQADYYSVKDRGAALRAIAKTPLVFGTIFDIPLYMAMRMEPVPDTIFFMTDGACAEERGVDAFRKMVKEMKEKGLRIPVVHTVGFGPDARDNSQLKAIAKITGGTSRALSIEQYERKYGKKEVRLPPVYKDKFQAVDANQFPIKLTF